jgi:hypothetical protein
MNLLSTLILIPIVGIFLISNIVSYSKVIEADLIEEQPLLPSSLLPLRSKKQCERDPLRLVLPEAAYAKQIALIISIINLIISFVIFISFNSSNQFI